MLTRADVELLRVRKAIRDEFPDFLCVRKTDYWYMHVIDFLLRLSTLGLTRRFLYLTTTIGNTLYIPLEWSEMTAYHQAVVLRHEGVHMRQRKRLGRIRYAFTYLFWPFPFIFARGRRDLEMEAYQETLRAYFEYYGEFVAIDTGIRTRTIAHFLNVSHGWMWPFRKDIQRWYDDTIADLLAETRNVHGQDQAG